MTDRKDDRKDNHHSVRRDLAKDLEKDLEKDLKKGLKQVDDGLIGDTAQIYISLFGKVGTDGAIVCLAPRVDALTRDFLLKLLKDRNVLSVDVSSGTIDVFLKILGINITCTNETVVADMTRIIRKMTARTAVQEIRDVDTLMMLDTHTPLDIINNFHGNLLITCHVVPCEGWTLQTQQPVTWYSEVGRHDGIYVYRRA